MEENIEKANLEQAEISNGEEKNEPESSASIGKFKNTEALLSAYTNLEAEFTKKSQALKKANELINLKAEETNKAAKDALPLYEKENWNNIVNDFVSEFPNAKNFTSEISKIICEDKDLSKEESCLLKAYLRVLNKEIKAPEEALNDDDFIENYVLQNDRIKKKILSSYLKSKSEIKTPSLLTEKNGAPIFSPVNAPRTIKEAGELARKILGD